MVDKIWYNMEELIGGSEERGINRNIVECKGHHKRRIGCVAAGINRNIVECKGIFRMYRRTALAVLIET